MISPEDVRFCTAQGTSGYCTLPEGHKDDHDLRPLDELKGDHAHYVWMTRAYDDLHAEFGRKIRDVDELVRIAHVRGREAGRASMAGLTSRLLADMALGYWLGGLIRRQVMVRRHGPLERPL